jgi:predicted deacetylase
MSEHPARAYIHTAITTLRQATGQSPQGWLGPDYGESARTPQLLAEAGIRYVCDWVNDEQLYRMHAPGRELFALPLTLELDDVHALWERRVRM